MLHPMKLRGYNSSKLSSCSSSHDSVTASSKKRKVASVLSTEDDDDDVDDNDITNQLQVQININKNLQDDLASERNDNTSLRAELETLKKTASLCATATESTTTTILAPFVASVLRDKTMTELLEEVQQLRNQRTTQALERTQFTKRMVDKISGVTRQLEESNNLILRGTRQLEAANNMMRNFFDNHHHD
eukprot:CAMPEP_0170935406 /NCGR_PEP_ID=MMETSP0735-20130129/19046_1 /TAXON_ID=186038 /ORGANISM="Fragilariopsis kerguelensis, Strain L26-C5" /LENGTH=189 /DNA_ID=CAMNT_0011339043 /DNA_START=1 /DNA_END=570 /DNA_ORIENTATION=-